MKRRPPRDRTGAQAQKAALRARGAGRGTPAPARGPAPAIPSLLVLALILLAVVFVHFDAVRLPFFADDYLFLEQVRSRSLFAALIAPDGLGNYFRPVGRQLYFWVLGRLSGESASVFHAANLVLFLGIVTLTFAVARRLAGPMAAAVAAGFLALHYAADVPIRWVAGSQDLLAVLGALGALALFLANQRMWAALPLLLGLLSKETVVLTPLVAVAAGRQPGEPWRASFLRAWPLGLAVAVWAALWLVTAPQRRGLGAALGLEPLGAVAVAAHLIHVSLGLEWRGLSESMSRVALPGLALIPVAVAVLGARASRPAGPDRPRAVTAGIVWALAATAPLVAVVSSWSAYYYLFALCGVALALGALAARGPRWVALAIVVALAAGSQAGRDNPEFASGKSAWNWQSHLNRRYFDRAALRIQRYLADMKRQRPTVPPRSTFFFAGIPAFLGWQTADGPLVRWAYRDTSLRSHYQSDFSLERAHRGPVFFFTVSGDTLHEEVRQAGALRGIALRTMLSDKIDTTRDLLVWLTEREPPAPDVLYFLAWLEWARGDTVTARHALEAAGIAPDRGPAPQVDQAMGFLAVGDTASAIQALLGGITRHALDSRVHGLSSDLMLSLNPLDAQARVEALAARVLAPRDPTTWMRWGLLQARDARHTHAIRSLEHAMTLGIPDARTSNQIQAILTELRRMIPGGELTQAGLRR